MQFNRLARLFQRLRRWIVLFGLIGTAILIALLWQQLQPAQNAMPTSADSTPTTWQNEPIQPIPLGNALDTNKVVVVKLGEKLFADTRLSIDNRVSCLSCHRLDQGGADGQARSIGATGVQTQVNTPTVFNVAYNDFRFGWDGRFETLEVQIEEMVQTVMGISSEQVITKLQQAPDYVRLFNAIYPDRITMPNVINAIAVYERSLITPNSRFDQFLRGDNKALKPKEQEGYRGTNTALTVDEQEGYRLFKKYGCVSCHQGVNVGGNLFQKFGVINNYFVDRGKITPADSGHYNVTGSENDRFVFRVPSLRNVAITPPYFHDGTAQTLDQAIAVMAKYQLGHSLPEKDVQQIVLFLKTLTGEPPGSAS